MKILGIDPGSNVTGFGIIEIKNGKICLLNYDSLKLPGGESINLRLKKIYDRTLKVIKKYKPDEFAIETAFYGKNVQSTLKLGQARGVAILAAINSKLCISEYSPREVKKSVTGSGASTKSSVQWMVKNILLIKETPEFIDSTDALAVALCHYYSINNFKSAHKKTRSARRKSWSVFVDNNKKRILNN